MRRIFAPIKPIEIRRNARISMRPENGSNACAASLATIVKLGARRREIGLVGGGAAEHHARAAKWRWHFFAGELSFDLSREIIILISPSWRKANRLPSARQLSANERHAARRRI